MYSNSMLYLLPFSMKIKQPNHSVITQVSMQFPNNPVNNKHLLRFGV